MEFEKKSEKILGQFLARKIVNEKLVSPFFPIGCCYGYHRRHHHWRRHRLLLYKE